MFNAVRMDIYRLIHTKSAYVILVIAMALAIAMKHGDREHRGNN